MTDIIAEIRTHDDLIEALRQAKGIRGLSNEWCDERLGLTKGHTDKALGPAREKSLSRMLFDTFHAGFAVKLLMVADPEAEAVMQAKWEGRDQSNVRVTSSRVSRKVLERAKPLVLSENGAIGGAVRSYMLGPKHRSDVARKAANALWKKRGRKKTRKHAKRRAWYRKTRVVGLRDSENA